MRPVAIFQIQASQLRRTRSTPACSVGSAIERVNQVWCADVTSIPTANGFLYLVVILDWVSRAVLAWRRSNTLAAEFCVEALEEALARYGRPEIFNTDQSLPQRRLGVANSPMTTSPAHWSATRSRSAWTARVAAGSAYCRALRNRRGRSWGASSGRHVSPGKQQRDPHEGPLRAVLRISAGSSPGIASASITRACFFA